MWTWTGFVYPQIQNSTDLHKLKDNKITYMV